MPTLQERIESVTEEAEANLQVMRAIVHGGAAETVETDGGPVPTVAKQVADLEAAYAAADAVAACAAERAAAEAGAATATDRAAVATGAAEMAVDAAAAANALIAQFPLPNTVQWSGSRALAAEDNARTYKINSAAVPAVITAPPSAASETGEVDQPFWFQVQRAGAQSVTLVSPDSTTINNSPNPYVVADGTLVQFQLQEFDVNGVPLVPHNWAVFEYGAAVGDAEPVGAVKTLATVEPGYLALNDSYFQVAETVPGAGDGYTALAAKMYVGDASNATAPYFYRFTDPGNPSGTRSTTGPYMKLPPSTAYVPVVTPGVVCIKAANSISVPVDVNLAGILAETQAQNALVQSYFAGSGSGAPVNVTGSRAPGTTYTNTSDRPRLVNVTAGTFGRPTQLVVGGVVAAQAYTGSTAPMSAVVPPGVTYSLTSGADITYWGETALITPGGMGSLSQTILGNTFPLVMGIQTIAHTLGKSPSRVEVRARCTVAEYGWAVGEGFTVWTAGPNNSDGGYSVLDRSASSVSLGWAAGYGSGKILKMIRKDTNAVANLTTNGNWVFDLEVFK